MNKGLRPPTASDRFFNNPSAWEPEDDRLFNIDIYRITIIQIATAFGFTMTCLVGSACSGKVSCIQAEAQEPRLLSYLPIGQLKGYTNPLTKFIFISQNNHMKTEEIKEAIAESLPVDEDINQLIEEVEIDNKNYSVAVTPNRIVLCKHSFPNRLTNEDYPATRFDTIKLNEGWRRTTVVVKLKDGTEIKLQQISKEDARKMAGYIRTMISQVEAGPKVTKICPDCGAHLNTLVKVCPHCEYDFKKSMRKR